MRFDAVSLQLLDPPLADWIRAADEAARRRFAFACAAATVAAAVRASEGELHALAAQLAMLERRARAACTSGARQELDRELDAHELRAGAELAILKRTRVGDDAGGYTRFRRVALLWYAARALRAALVLDSLTAAGRAAFTTIAATQDDARVWALTRGDDDDEANGGATGDGRGRA
jgi:hypothetical protein